MPPAFGGRTRGFTESVIRGMSALAREHGAINLAQGFPDFPAPALLKEAAARAIADDVNQYAITWGSRRLREALARKYTEWYGMDVNPETDITVTCGSTEAMVATLIPAWRGDASANFSGSSSKNAFTTIGCRIQFRNSGPMVSLRLVKS